MRPLHTPQPDIIELLNENILKPRAKHGCLWCTSVVLYWNIKLDGSHVQRVMELLRHAVPNVSALNTLSWFRYLPVICCSTGGPPISYFIYKNLEAHMTIPKKET